MSHSALRLLQRHHQLLLHLHDDLFLNIVLFVYRLEGHQKKFNFIINCLKIKRSDSHLKHFLVFILDGAQKTLLLRYDLLAVNQLSLLLNDLMPGALQ